MISSRCASPTGSMCRWMKLSRARRGAWIENAVSRPCASRATFSTGWATSRTSILRPASSTSTEINEKRHVIIDDLNDRVRLAAIRFAALLLDDPDFWLARCPHLQECPGLSGKLVAFAWRIAGDVLGRRVLEQRGGELVASPNRIRIVDRREIQRFGIRNIGHARIDELRYDDPVWRTIVGRLL